MTSEAAVIIAVVVLLSFFVTVAVAVVSLADFDIYKAFLTSFNLKKHRDLHPLPPKMSIVG